MEEPSYTNIKVENAEPTRLQTFLHKLLRYTLYLVAACITFAATSKTISVLRTEKDTPSEANPFPYGTIHELTELKKFKAAYLQANCNTELLQSIQTIRLTGHMGNEGESLKFSILKKRPNQILFTIDHDLYDMTFGVNGPTVWRRIRTSNQADQTSLLEDEEAQEWLDQREFFDVIITATLGRGSIKPIKIATWQRSKFLKVTVTEANGEKSVEVLVNPQTMYPEVELKRLEDGSLQKTIFSNYENIKGMPIPFKIESFIDNTPQNTIILKAASINCGIPSDLFGMPQSLITE